MIYDAHLHLQDPRLESVRPDLPDWLTREEVDSVVVNGTHESDWPVVDELAQQIPQVIPSYGLHPWWIEKRSNDWLGQLKKHLDTGPSAIGEIGLDKWFKKENMEDQASVFLDQWHLANQRQLPVTIHCLKAWGKLLELIKKYPHQGPGFLLHSYSGPKEMIHDWVKLGARFSISGYFAHPRKASRLEVFKNMPLDRILIETDAPDMTPPENWIAYPLPQESNEKALNHPGNLKHIYHFAAEWLQIPQHELEAIVASNFRQLFGQVM